MQSINKFDLNVYSEERFPVSESDYNEVMSLMTEESEGFQCYAMWSAQLESPSIVAESDNFIAYKDGSVEYKGKAQASTRYQGIEI